MAGPLSGINVLEFSQVIAATFAGQLIAELGADVIKGEPPAGDSWRLQLQFAPNESRS
ncbi:MAG: CoA transferase, partial [Gammaproteobacteria bacterium]|nr:CoA transferase [Gammaproteobacteria bacterium]